MNRFSNLSTSTFKPLSLDEILMVPMARQKQHDDAQDMADKYSALQARRLDVDSEGVDARVNELRSKSDSLSDELLNSGVNRSLLNRFRELKRETEKEYSQEGLIGNAQSNYDSAMKFVNELATEKERQAGWSPAQAKKWASGQVAAFKGTSDEGGQFRHFSGQELTTKVDRNKWINDNLQTIASDQSEIMRKYGGPHKFQTMLQENMVEEKDLEKIMTALQTRASGDTDLMQSLQQESFFTGEENATSIGDWKIVQDAKGNNRRMFVPSSSFGQQLYGASLGAQFRKQSLNTKVVNDPAGLALFKHGLDIQQADMLVRAANGEAKTITHENIDKIKNNAEMAKGEMNGWKAKLDSGNLDPNSREYIELKDNYNRSMIKYNNLTERISGIQNQVKKTLSPNEKKLYDAGEELSKLVEGKSEAQSSKILRDELTNMGVDPDEAISTGGAGLESAKLQAAYFKAKGVSGDFLGSDTNANNAWAKVRDVRNKMESNTKDYLENNPYSESAIELGGLGSGKYSSTIGAINKNLTDNFDGAGYSIAYEGTSLNAYMADKYDEDKIVKEIRVTGSQDESGYPMESLIIKDKETGQVLETKYVSRGNLGLPEQRKAAKALMNSGDPDQEQIGQQMAANIEFSPTVKSAGLRKGGKSGMFDKSVELEDGRVVPMKWEKRINASGSTVWKVTADGEDLSGDLYGEDETVNWFYSNSYKEK